VGSSERGQVVSSVVEIGSQDVARLLGVPNLGFSDSVSSRGDFNESSGLPDDIVTSKVPHVPSIKSHGQVELGPEEGKGRVHVIEQLSEEDGHDENSSVEVSEGELSHGEVSQSKTSEELVYGHLSIVSMVGLEKDIFVN